MEQGRSLEIGFTSNNLPLAKGNFSEDTESQYADELRRQAYIQTLGRLIFTICIKFMLIIFPKYCQILITRLLLTPATPDLIKVKGIPSTDT